MMAVSEAKLMANRRNAKKSTGPRTEAGKTRSRLNALKHGILAGEAVIRAGEGAEEAEAFERLLDELESDLAPSGMLDGLLVERLAVVAWRWRRLLRYELGLIREQADDATANWTSNQMSLWATVARIGGPPSGGDPSETAGWIDTDDLLGSVELAEEELAAVSRPSPLDQPSEAVLAALATAAEDTQLPVSKILHIPEDRAWYLYANEDWTQAEEGRSALARLLGALCEARDMTDEQVWEWLRTRAQMNLEKAQRPYERRLRQEERVRMLVVLPPQKKLDQVMRYEAHLSRLFTRTLDEFERVRRMTHRGEAA